MSPVEVVHDAGLGARLTLAEMLSHYPGRHAQARQAYQELERDYPRQPEVQLGIAELCVRDGDYSQAAEHRARAAMLLDDSQQGRQ